MNEAQPSDTSSVYFVNASGRGGRAGQARPGSAFERCHLIHLQRVPGRMASGHWAVQGNATLGCLAVLGDNNDGLHLMLVSCCGIRFTMPTACPNLGPAAWFDDHSKESTTYLVDSNSYFPRENGVPRRLDLLFHRLQIDVASTKNILSRCSKFLAP